MQTHPFNSNENPLTQASPLGAGFLGNAALKTSPFVVPEGYFAGLTQRVMERIRRSEEARREAFRAPWYVSKMPYIAAACIVALSFVISSVQDVLGTDVSSVAASENKATVVQDGLGVSVAEADNAYDYLMISGGVDEFRP
ncbi:MAG: hypothetical protein ACI3YC_05870 [Alloprevotella sp.]